MGHSRSMEPRPRTDELLNHTTPLNQIAGDLQLADLQLWKVFFENNPEAVAVLDDDGCFLRINAEFTRLFGYESDDVIGRSIDDLIVPEPLIEPSREYRRLLKQGKRVEVDTVRMHKDGRELHVSLLAVPVATPSGQHFADCAIYRDITARKRAEERLRESEARFQVLADTAPVMIWMTGTDGLCNYFNKPWLDFTGRTMEQEVGTGWMEGVHPDDVQACFDHYLPHFHAREPFRMEYRLRRRDGEYRWIIESGIPRYTASGEFAGYIGSNIDITEHKRAESLLAGEKRILEMLAKGHSLPEILEALCRFVEEQASDILASILLLEDNRLRHGAAPSLPRTYTDAIDGALIGPSAGSCGTAAFLGKQVIAEDLSIDPLWADYKELASRQGLRACWSTPVFSSADKVIATFAMYCRHPKSPTRHHLEIIECITHLAGLAIERKLAQDALRNSEAYLTEAQRMAHLGTWVWRVEGREPEYLSDEWYRIYEFDPHEGTPNWERRLQRIHPHDRNRWVGTIERALRDKSDYEVEFRILLPGGTIKHLNTVGHPVFDPAGELIKFIGISIDITDRKRAEQERERLQQLEADLARINRVTMMGELAASLAHEIKQPVTAAMLNAKACKHWLAGKAPDLAEACSAAERMVGNTERTAQIIDRVRSLYSRDTARRELLDVNEIIGEMSVLLHERATRGSVSMRSVLAPTLPQVTADRVQLQQVLTNLMLNGIEAMKDTGGELTITTALSGNEYLQISVSDAGIGIAPEQIDKIFEAFYTTKQQGTGMGLSISRRIIESHGGRIWVSANAVRGTTFSFTLPILAATASFFSI